MLPEKLNACDLEDVLRRIGAAVDRTNIARALAQVEIAGVVAPSRRGEGWQIPRKVLAEAIAACLQRRAQRAAARSRMPLPPFEEFLTDAARRMERDAELVPLVPRRVRSLLRRQEEAAAERRRLAEQRAQELRAARERAFREAEERRQATIEAERQRLADVARQREAEERERLVDGVYSALFRRAMKVYGVVLGQGWQESPEGRRFLNDWPNGAMGGRPSWWRPPPGALEFAAAERKREKRAGEPEPDFAQFLGGYRFGDPWPWRSDRD